jgi:hypothetical protein
MDSNQPNPTFAILPGQQQQIPPDGFPHHQQQAPAYSQAPQQQQQHYQQQPPSQPGYSPSYPPQQQQRSPPQQQQQQQQQVTPPHSGGAILPQPPVLLQPKNRTPNVKARLDDQPLMTRTPDEETEDGRLRNREAVAKIRETWIYKQVRARQDEFTQYRKVCRRMMQSYVELKSPAKMGVLSFCRIVASIL